ncbi:MAG: SH3 domain-containing protein [Pararhodobacter sp.]|nr:SH3 domain-containing protein [Pararhodobacter sp.]
MTRFLTAALATMLITLGTAAHAGWITRDVNLRAGPSTGHRIHTVLRSCTQVDLRGTHRGWYRVVSRSGQGWVSGRYVSYQRPSFCRSRAQDRAPAFLHPPRHSYRAPHHRSHRPHDRRGQRHQGHRPPRHHQQDAPQPPYWGP